MLNVKKRDNILELCTRFEKKNCLMTYLLTFTSVIRKKLGKILRINFYNSCCLYLQCHRKHPLWQ